MMVGIKKSKLKAIATLAFAANIWGCSTISPDVAAPEITAPEMPEIDVKVEPVALKANNLVLPRDYSKDYKRFENVDFSGLSVDERNIAAAAHVNVLRSTYALRYNHVSRPSIASLMEGYDYQAFLENLDPAKDYTESEIYAEVAEDINEMLARIDPHARFMTQKDSLAFQMTMQDKAKLIGITYDAVDGGMEILGVVDDSAADTAGIKTGDIITHANGKSFEGMSRQDIGKYLDTLEKLSFKVTRDGQSLESPIDLVRTVVQVDNVKGFIMNDDIAYITFSSFTQNTRQEFGETLARLSEKSGNTLKGLVIDLSYNGGGSLDAVMALADDLTEQEVLLGTVGYRGDAPVARYYAGNAAAQITDLPIVVMQNNFSASASEILAGILQDYERATVIGTGQSFGKATMQSMRMVNFEGEGDASLSFTTGHIFLPKSGSYQLHGIMPDILVPRPEREQKIIEGSKGRPVNAREYEYYIPNPGGDIKQGASLKCDVDGQSNLVDIFDLKTGILTEDTDVKGDAALLCALDHLSEKPKYTTTGPNTPPMS